MILDLPIISLGAPGFKGGAPEWSGYQAAPGERIWEGVRSVSLLAKESRLDTGGGLFLSIMACRSV